MAPGPKPKWTRDDTHLCLQMAVGFVGSGAMLGWMSDDGMFWGAIGGAGLWGIIMAAALIDLAHKRLRR
jgi:hypothetical protein